MGGGKLTKEASDIILKREIEDGTQDTLFKQDIDEEEDES